MTRYAVEGQALRFGVTTELDLFSFPHKMAEVRRAATAAYRLSGWCNASSSAVRSPTRCNGVYWLGSAGAELRP